MGAAFMSEEKKDPVLKECEDCFRRCKRQDGEGSKQYKNRIKATFEDYVLNKEHRFRGKPVLFKREKDKNGTLKCFRHIVSNGRKDGLGRSFDRKRYEVSNLVFAILDHCDFVACTSVSVKPDGTNRGKNRLSIKCARFKYVIILEDEGTHWLFITAFPRDEENDAKYE